MYLCIILSRILVILCQKRIANVRSLDVGVSVGPFKVKSALPHKSEWIWLALQIDRNYLMLFLDTNERPLLWLLGQNRQDILVEGKKHQQQ